MRRGGKVENSFLKTFVVLQRGGAGGADTILMNISLVADLTQWLLELRTRNLKVRRMMMIDFDEDNDHDADFDDGCADCGNVFWKTMIVWANIRFQE